MVACSIVCVIVGVIIFVLGIVIGWVVIPPIVEQQIKDNVILKNGTEQYDRWQALPIALDFKIYFFQVLNPEEAVDGETIQVEEVGPYIYKQTREKFKVSFNEETKEYSYVELQKFEFDEERSAPLKDTDVLTIINTPMVALIQIVEDHPVFKKILKNVNSNMKYIFPNQSSIFMNTTVKDILFDGYDICPNYKKLPFLAKTICNQIENFAPKEVVRLDDGSYRFSFFSYKETLDNGFFTVNSGITDFTMTGQLTAYNFSEYTNFWNGENSTCNKVHGTDATIFPPLLKKDQLLTIYHPDVCRTIDISYSGDTVYKNINGLRFSLTKESMSAPSEEAGTDCYCIKRTRDMFGELECMRDGALELFSCHDAPIVLTLPHLYMADDYYTNNTVEGLEPNETQHSTFVDLEMNTGTPLRGTKRVQLNVFLRKTPKIERTYNLKPAIAPIFWLDEGIELNDELINMLKREYFLPLKLLTIGKWSIIALGLAMSLISGLFYICRRNKTKHEGRVIKKY